MKLTKEQIYTAIGYILFMTGFFLIGITKQRLEAFVAIGLLTGLYFLIVRFVKKIAVKVTVKK